MILAVMTAAAICAGLSKGNGLLVLVVILIGFGTALLEPEPRAAGVDRRILGVAVAVFLVCSLSGWVALGPYRELRREWGSPFVTNRGVAELPGLFERQDPFRPGIRSIADGFFTFRLLDLLEHPTLRNDNEWYPQSRTSLWTLLYARFHFSRFASWPPSWESSRRFALAVWASGWTLCATYVVDVALLSASLAQQRERVAWIT